MINAYYISKYISYTSRMNKKNKEEEEEDQYTVYIILFVSSLPSFCKSAYFYFFLGYFITL